MLGKSCKLQATYKYSCVKAPVKQTCLCLHFLVKCFINTCNDAYPSVGPCIVQGNVDANVARQNELLVVINKNTAAYRQAFGFREWRQACEVWLLMSTTRIACFYTLNTATSCCPERSPVSSASIQMLHACLSNSVLCNTEVLRSWLAEPADIQ